MFTIARARNYKDDPNFKKPICPCCGKTYSRQQDYFFKNTQSPLWKANNGFIPICKDCVLKMYNTYKYELNSSREAMKILCARFDMYYSDETFDSATKLGSNFCSSYFARKNVGQSKNKTYINNVKEELVDKVTSLVDAEDKNVDRESVEFWGAGYNSKEYKILNNEYSSWVVKIGGEEKLDKSLETVLKQVCKFEIDLQRAREKNAKPTEISALSKSYLDCLASAGLKPSQEDNTNIAESNSLGSLIEKWEETEPVPKPSKEFEDVDGIKKYIDIWFKGHLAKMYGIQNDTEREYEEEINKYKVQSPEDDNI